MHVVLHLLPDSNTNCNKIQNNTGSHTGRDYRVNDTCHHILIKQVHTTIRSSNTQLYRFTLRERDNTDVISYNRFNIYRQEVERRMEGAKGKESHLHESPKQGHIAITELAQHGDFPHVESFNGLKQAVKVRY